jgi:hypothetical protein
MKNPAALLLQQLREWTPPSDNESHWQSRSISANWDEMRLAVDHLNAIDQLLNQMEKTEGETRVWRKNYPRWAQMVFAYHHGWSYREAKQDFSEEALDHLATLSRALKTIVPEADTTQFDKVRSFIDNIDNLLSEETSIPGELRMHLNDVLDHARWCLDNYEIIGDFKLQEALERLAVAVMRGAWHSDSKEKWRDTFTTWVWPFVVNIASALPCQALTLLALGN